MILNNFIFNITKFGVVYSKYFKKGYKLSLDISER